VGHTQSSQGAGHTSSLAVGRDVCHHCREAPEASQEAIRSAPARLFPAGWNPRAGPPSRSGRGRPPRSTSSKPRVTRAPGGTPAWCSWRSRASGCRSARAACTAWSMRRSAGNRI